MRKHFGDHLPTSTTVEVRRLVPRGFGLEVDAIAAIRAPRAPSS
jgi:enamine deaminase RidA (YjgF/YER057c/UK114 family)